MNLVRIPLLLAILLFAAGELRAQARRSSPNFGEQSTVEFKLGRWRSDLASELRLSGGGNPGSTLDPTEDLGFSAERTWDFQVGIRFARRLKARGNWFQVKYDAAATPASELCIGGLCTPGGDELSSRVELEQLRVGAEFDFLRGSYGYLAVLGEYGRFEMRSAFESSAGSVTPDTQLIELPLVGLKGRIYLTPALALTVEGAGMRNENEGVMTDFDAAATYNVVPNFALSYGYRNSYHRFKSLEPEGDRAVLRLRGQYLSVIVRF